jgi:hypothetical protein
LLPAPLPDQPVGAGAQIAGRGLVPRLSTGTLQLSIRCSSINFLPSRSFPVSTQRRRQTLRRVFRYMLIA